MANSKSTKPAKTKSTKRPNSKSKKLDNGQEFDIEPAMSRSSGDFSTIEIGHVAGDVWELLSRDSGLTVSAIKKSVDAPADLVLAAIGWLAREDKVEFSTQGRSVKVSLR